MIWFIRIVNGAMGLAFVVDAFVMNNPTDLPLFFLCMFALFMTMDMQYPDED